MNGFIFGIIVWWDSSVGRAVWRCGRYGYCTGLKIRRSWFDSNRLHHIYDVSYTCPHQILFNTVKAKSSVFLEGAKRAGWKISSYDTEIFLGFIFVETFIFEKDCNLQNEKL